MDLAKLERDIKSSYNFELTDVRERIDELAQHIQSEWHLDINQLTLHEIRSITTTVLELETKNLHDEVESLMAQKERIERALKRKAEELQHAKYNLFNAMEAQLSSDDTEALAKLHQVKLQSIDLFDFLAETVESAIITTLEKANESDVKEIKETLEEIIKELAFEAIKEGSLNTIRIRKILSTILQSAIDIAEAEPNKAEYILHGTVKGMRGGLLQSIHRFKKRLAYMPIEAKHILIEDYDTIIEDLNQTDTLFSQVIQTQADKSPDIIKGILTQAKSDMSYDLEELLYTSRETADVMRERFASFAKQAVRRADSALKSQTAQEAKRMGKQAWGVAKNALGSAIKSAKEKIENKDK